MELVVEHGSTRSGRWLRRNRTRIALLIAVVEAVLIVVDVIPLWPAVVAALGLLALYFFVGRKLRSDTLRHTSWIGAVSQLMIVALPLLLPLLTLAVLVALAIIALVAVGFLFLDRR